MSRSYALALLLTAAAVAAPPASQPATEPSDRPAFEAEQASLPHHAPLPVNQVLGFSLDHDLIHAKALLPPTENKFGIDLPGWPGFATGQFRVQGAWFTLNHFALLDHDDTEINTYVDLRPDYLQINRSVETPTHMESMTLIQSQQNADDAGGDAVSFTVQDGPKGPSDTAAVELHFKAANATELFRQHPAEVRQYLLPAMKSLGGGAVLRSTDAAAAWQVLGHGVAVDVALARRIDGLLVRLDADDFAARTKAEEELIALGPAGAAALQQRDLSTLAPEPKSSVEEALRHNQPLSNDRAAELSQSLPFLCDALMLEDPRLVAAAAARLKQLTGRNPDVAASLPMDERERRVEAYRTAVMPATMPTSPHATDADHASAFPSQNESRSKVSTTSVISTNRRSRMATKAKTDAATRTTGVAISASRPSSTIACPRPSRRPTMTSPRWCGTASPGSVSRCRSPGPLR